MLGFLLSLRSPALEEMAESPILERTKANCQVNELPYTRLPARCAGYMLTTLPRTRLRQDDSESEAHLG